jgi:hypothetical protein
LKDSPVKRSDIATRSESFDRESQQNTDHCTTEIRKEVYREISAG